jgi:hypothetical protein
LPLALGLQIILFHNLREGLPVRWSVPMGGEDSTGAVDILAQMRKSLANADHSNNRHN